MLPEPADETQQIDLDDELLTDEDQIDVKLGEPKRLILTELGRKPSCAEISTAWWSLKSTHTSIAGLFETVYLLRQQKKAKNLHARRLSGDALDVLRAAIVFTSAGVDACLTRLLKQAVPLLIQHNDNARRKFQDFIHNQIYAPEVESAFVDAIKADHPRDRMLQLHIDQLVKPSFQGSGDITERGRDALGITNAQMKKQRIAKLDPFFTARNEVAHEMDQLPPTRPNTRPPRRHRNQIEVRDMCNSILLLLRDLIKATADNISKCPKDRTTAIE